MLLQTNSYVVPKERRSEHSRLMRRFRQVLARLGCDHFEVFEQVGSNWNTGEATGRFVQIMRFRDRKHQQAVQTAERTDPAAQQFIREFCELINFPYQQQQGLFAIGFYTSVLPVSPTRVPAAGQPIGPDATPPNGPLDAGLEAEPVHGVSATAAPEPEIADPYTDVTPPEPPTPAAQPPRRDELDLDLNDLSLDLDDESIPTPEKDQSAARQR
jgi:hypothetical protein